MIATAGGLPTLVGLLEAPALPVQAMASLAIAEVCAIHTSQGHARPHATMLPRYRTHPLAPALPFDTTHTQPRAQTSAHHLRGRPLASVVDRAAGMPAGLPRQRQESDGGAAARCDLGLRAVAALDVDRSQSRGRRRAVRRRHAWIRGNTPHVDSPHVLFTPTPRPSYTHAMHAWLALRPRM